MNVLDTILVALIWLFVLALSTLRLFRRFRGQFNGYGQTADLPESWRRWLLGEKRVGTSHTRE